MLYHGIPCHAMLYEDKNNEYYDNEDNDNEANDNKDNNNEGNNNIDNDMPCLRSLSPISRDHLADLSRTLSLLIIIIIWLRNVAA